jgi:hypothetical protein
LYDSYVCRMSMMPKSMTTTTNSKRSTLCVCRNHHKIRAFKQIDLTTVVLPENERLHQVVHDYYAVDDPRESSRTQLVHGCCPHATQHGRTHVSNTRPFNVKCGALTSGRHACDTRGQRQDPAIFRPVDAMGVSVRSHIVVAEPKAQRTRCSGTSAPWPGAGPRSPARCTPRRRCR